MLERNIERLKLGNGAVVEVYQTPRRKRFYTVRVTLPDGAVLTQGGFGAMVFAWEWGLARARAEEGRGA